MAAVTSRGSATTNPGLPVEHGLGRSARAPRELGYPAGRGLEEHDAEPLLLEPAPTVAAQHREDVGAAVGAGQTARRAPGRGTRHGRRCRRPPVRDGPVAPTAGDRENQVGVRRPEPARRLEQDVEALARNQPADPGDHQGIGRQAQLDAHRGPGRRVEWMEAVAVDTGRDDGDRQRTAGGPLAFRQRVATGRDDESRAEQHAPQGQGRAGDAARHRDLGAVEHEPVGMAQVPAEQAERQSRVEHHQLSADLVGQLVDPATERRVRQKDRVRSCGRRGNPAPRPTRPSPRRAL